MNTKHRNYAEAQGDFERMAHFITDNDDQMRTFSTWCLGRFVDWKYGLYAHKRAVPNFCQQNAQLWFDSFHRLVGFAIAEDGDANFAIITLPGYRFLFAEILDWVQANWGNRGRLTLEVTAQQTLETAVLSQHGFQQKGAFYTQRFDLLQPLAAREPVAEGFTIVDMVTNPDFAAQRRLRAEAFAGKSQLTNTELQQELLFHNYLHTGPIYHAPTDLCVLAADGRFVAGCEALIDAHNASAEVERVCTHSAFRRRGLARAVTIECLHRLREMGLHRAYITGYSEAAMTLYASLGAGQKATAFIYEALG